MTTTTETTTIQEKQLNNQLGIDSRDRDYVVENTYEFLKTLILLTAGGR